MGEKVKNWGMEVGSLCIVCDRIVIYLFNNILILQYLQFARIMRLSGVFPSLVPVITHQEFQGYL